MKAEWGIIIVTSILSAVTTMILSTECHAEGTECNFSAEKCLQKTYPNFKYTSIDPTEIEGIFQIITKPKKNIIYFVANSGHLIFGEVWTKRGENLTQKKWLEIASSEIDKKALAKAIRIGPADGTKQVIEITDPDCPFCRHGSKFLDSQAGITRYIFFYPLSSHPEAAKKAKFILASKNPRQTYQDVMAGKFDSKPLPMFEENGVLEEHIKIAKKLGVKGTPNYWVDGVSVSGADTHKLSKLIGQDG